MTDERLQSMEQNAGNWNTAGCLEFVAEVKRLRRALDVAEDQLRGMLHENVRLKEEVAGSERETSLAYKKFQDALADNARLREVLERVDAWFAEVGWQGKGELPATIRAALAGGEK